MVLTGGSQCPTNWDSVLVFSPLLSSFMIQANCRRWKIRTGRNGTDKGKETVHLRYSVSREPYRVMLDLEGWNGCKKLGLVWWYSHLAAWEEHMADSLEGSTLLERPDTVEVLFHVLHSSSSHKLLCDLCLYWCLKSEFASCGLWSFLIVLD